MNASNCGTSETVKKTEPQQIPKWAREYFKEWALDFRCGEQMFGFNPVAAFTARLEFYSTVSGPIRIEWSFLWELLNTAAGHIAADYSHAPMLDREKLLQVQREAQELAPWSAAILGLEKVVIISHDGLAIEAN